jgi:hypothetical protein
MNKCIAFSMLVPSLVGPLIQLIIQNSVWASQPSEIEMTMILQANVLAFVFLIFACVETVILIRSSGTPMLLEFHCTILFGFLAEVTLLVVYLIDFDVVSSLIYVLFVINILGIWCQVFIVFLIVRLLKK